MSDLVKARDYQGKRVNPTYRLYTQGNPSWVIFRPGTQFFRDAWTAQNYLKQGLPGFQV